MQNQGNTVLITGGATGIGLALAIAFADSGNTVIICGRREHKLLEVQQQHPAIHIRRCDVGDAAQRTALYEWARASFPNLNMLVNNAGVQRSIDLKQGAAALVAGDDEVEINLTAPIHLAALFVPQLLQQTEAAIINISSGLGFIPMAYFPVYCATKAALHSFSVSLRQQLKGTPVRVFEIIPPTVRSELNMASRRKRGMENAGIDPEILAADTLQALATETYEKPVGEAQRLVQAARSDPDAAFKRMNGG